LPLYVDMNEEEIRQLYERYLNGETSEAETQQLQQALADPANQELVKALLESSFEKESGSKALPEESSGRYWRITLNKTGSEDYGRVSI
jgi:hypothetical protein